MMNVGGFDTIQQAEARAIYYRSRGYRVSVVTVRSDRAGSHIFLTCRPMQG